MMNAAKGALRDPHPYGRSPVTQAAHSVYVPFYLEKVGRTAGAYFTLGPLVLGWPWLAAKFCQQTGI